MKKSAIKNLLPDYRFKKITDLRPDFFSGAQLLIFDVDNTPVFSETAKSAPEVISWFSEIKNRYQCICISNSRTISDRAEDISNLLGCEVFLSRHKKPSKRLFKEIKAKYMADESKTFVIGDRIFTDILFGNLNGLTTVLVGPLSSKESAGIKIIRGIEAAALFLLGFLIYNKEK